MLQYSLYSKKQDVALTIVFKHHEIIINSICIDHITLNLIEISILHLLCIDLHQVIGYTAMQRKLEIQCALSLSPIQIKTRCRHICNKLYACKVQNFINFVPQRGIKIAKEWQPIVENKEDFWAAIKSLWSSTSVCKS